MGILEKLCEVIGIIMPVLLVILICLVVIRVIYKKKKGKTIDIEPVGVFRDLPSSVTGMNKDKDR